MIDLTIDPKGLENAVAQARQRKILIPTFRQLRDPGHVPFSIVRRLAKVGLWDVDPLNLFRLTWHNEPKEHGGGFGPVNFVEFPSSVTGCKARIIGLAGKWFPTGAHKVGAAFGCLVPRLVTGQFDPTRQKAVWPSTGNYCRGGAYDSALLGCESIAILPEGMSRERFEWLENVAGEIIKTPGSESNVKEIFDKCWELRKSGQDLMIFNQFEEFGNYLWHYHVTGPSMAEVLEDVMGPGDEYRGLVVATGSAGTIAAGDYLKEIYPHSKIGASEALQCPTLLYNGFGDHRIEGIGDKHIPWIHNIKNTDVVIALDDEAPVSVMRLFNSPAGLAYLRKQGVSESLIEKLPWLGISCIGNLMSAVKFAKFYDLEENDVVLTVFTDSLAMYGSRLEEYDQQRGPVSELDAAAIYHRYLMGQTVDSMEELTYPQRKRVHNLKYYTWVEQQGKSHAEIQAQWFQRDYWTSIRKLVDQIDPLIHEFNQRTGLAEEL
ncbi:pyridoxal-phosphate dependent enzyme [bacterium]|nr:pyridoxal-phosphate dependent enzyme [bacterium]